MRLSLDGKRRLHLAFFLDRAASAANELLDLLGFGCQSKVGQLLTLDTVEAPTNRTEPYLVIAATYDFDWGRCPSRVHAVESNDLGLRIADHVPDDVVPPLPAA